MRRKIALALAACLLLALTLTGCGGGTPTPTPAPTVPPSDAATEDPTLSFPPIVVHSTDPNATDPPPAPTDPPATPEPTATPVPAEDPAITINPNVVPYQTTYDLDIEVPPLLDNGLELPISGATGFASVSLPVWPANPGDRAGYKLASTATSLSDPAGASVQSLSSTQFHGAIAVLVPGTGFQIIEEVGDWWHINFIDPNSLYGETLTTGWIEHRYCFINLPDVIPSILYNDTNCSGSVFTSCGKDIPNVTGKIFYSTYAFNVRLNRNEYIMPMLYVAARDVCAAQHKVLAEGNCLEIYQAFRPLDTQKSVAAAVAEMAKVDPDVKAGVSTAPWDISWFVSGEPSQHQVGFAVDVSLVRMKAGEIKQVSNYKYFRCTAFDRYTMPTPMHELSLAAASQVSPGNATLSKSMQNSPCAQGLRRYFTTSGFTPLASSWWQFNNTAAQRATTACPSKGDYFTELLYSTSPDFDPLSGD